MWGLFLTLAIGKVWNWLSIRDDCWICHAAEWPGIGKGARRPSSKRSSRARVAVPRVGLRRRQDSAFAPLGSGAEAKPGDEEAIGAVPMGEQLQRIVPCQVATAGDGRGLINVRDALEHFLAFPS